MLKVVEDGRNSKTANNGSTRGAETATTATETIPTPTCDNIEADSTSEPFRTKGVESVDATPSSELTLLESSDPSSSKRVGSVEPMPSSERTTPESLEPSSTNRVETMVATPTCNGVCGDSADGEGGDGTKCDKESVSTTSQLERIEWAIAWLERALQSIQEFKRAAITSAHAQ